MLTVAMLKRQFVGGSGEIIAGRRRLAWN